MSELNESLQGRQRKRDKQDLILNIVLVAVIVLTLVTFVLSNYVFCLATVDGASMENTFHTGDTVVATKIKKAERGDVVIVQKDDEWVIKRIIAVGGDSIKIDKANGCVYLKVSGQEEYSLLEEEYIKEPYSTFSHDGNKFEWVVPQGYVFYMGDNRVPSLDCRNYGPVSEENVVGVLSNWAIKNKGLTTKLFGWLA